MLSIRFNFEKAKRQSPQLGDYPLLAEAVKGKNFTRKQIRENFNKLVSKDEYSSTDKYNLINNLYSLSKTLVDRQIDTKNRPGDSRKQQDDSILTKREKDVLKAKKREEIKSCIWEDYVRMSAKNINKTKTPVDAGELINNI